MPRRCHFLFALVAATFLAGCDSGAVVAGTAPSASIAVGESQVTAVVFDEIEPAGTSRLARVPMTVRFTNTSPETVWLRTCASTLAVQLLRRGESAAERVVCGLDVLTFETLAPGEHLERSVDLIRCLEGACRGAQPPLPLDGRYRLVGWYSVAGRDGVPDFDRESRVFSASFIVASPASQR